LGARWYDLGTQLLTHDTVGTLDVIKVDHPNDASACCNKMFVKWLELQPDATWSQLIKALNSIGMKAAVDSVNKYLIKGMYFYIHNYYRIVGYYCEGQIIANLQTRIYLEKFILRHNTI